MLFVFSTVRTNFCSTELSSLVHLADAMAANWLPLYLAKDLATTSRASSQEASTKEPSFLIRGVVRRFWSWTKSRPNLPLTQAWPLLTMFSVLGMTLVILSFFTWTSSWQPTPQ